MTDISSKTLLTEGAIWKKMILFALPLFFGNLFQQLYNNALAAVTSSGSLIFLLVGFFNGIAVGAGVVIARYYGARNIEMLHKAIHTTVGFGIVSGVLLTIFGIWFTPHVLIWMKTPSDVLPESITYFRIYFLGSLAFVLYNNFVGILQSVGDSRHPLYYLIFSSVVNIVLDLLFVGVFHLGVGSAAAATVISHSSEPLYAQTDHPERTARRHSEFCYINRKCSHPVQYQPLWENCGCRVRLLFQDRRLCIPPGYVLFYGPDHLCQSESWSR